MHAFVPRPRVPDQYGDFPLGSTFFCINFFFGELGAVVGAFALETLLTGGIRLFAFVWGITTIRQSASGRCITERKRGNVQVLSSSHIAFLMSLTVIRCTTSPSSLIPVAWLEVQRSSLALAIAVVVLLGVRVWCTTFRFSGIGACGSVDEPTSILKYRRRVFHGGWRRGSGHMYGL